MRSPRPSPARRALLLAGASLGAAGCAPLQERVRAAVFRPSREVPASFPGLRDGDQRLRVAVDSGDGAPGWVAMWWLPAATAGAPALLYLHGTHRNLYHNHPKLQAIRDAGFSVLAVEYRGWGDSSPLLPSEASIVADAELGWRELVQREPEPGRRVIYGHSMGTPVAVEIAARHSNPPAHGGLILESAFTRSADLAAVLSVFGGPVAWLLSPGFDALARIGAVRGPILMLHGTADRTVPATLGRRLFDAAPSPRTFVEFEGGSHSRLHDDDPARYHEAFAGFAAKLHAPR